MWVTLFALATAASVWFSAADLAVQLRKDQTLVTSVIESRRQTRDGSRHFSSAAPSNATPAISQID
jgi:hypothetical protein